MKLPDKTSQTTMEIYICGILAVGMLGYLLFDGISILAFQWIRLGEYWRFLIIPVSIYFVWIKRKDLRSIEVHPDLSFGIPVLIVSCVAYILWKVTVIDTFIEIGVFVLCFGCILLFFGRNFAKVFLFSLFYLVFMTSILVRLISPITNVLQLISAIGSSWLLNISGYTVLRDGNFLRLPHMVLEVATVCSGTSQLIALMAFAFPLGMMQLSSSLPRFILVALTIPIALMTNVIRIFFIAVWNYSGPKAAIHGPHGILDLPVIYPLALITLYLCSVILSRVEKKTNPVSLKAVPDGEKQEHPQRLFSVRPAWYIGCFIMAVTIAFPWMVQTKNVKYVNSVGEFPLLIGEWKGENDLSPPVSFYLGNPDEAVSRKYRGNDGLVLCLYIARFNRQSTWKRMTSFNSSIFKNTINTIGIPLDSFTEINVSVFRSAEGKETIAWFEIDGMSRPWIAQARRTAISSTIRKKRNNGMFVAVSTTAGNVEGRAEDQLQKFIRSILPYIKKIQETR
jgi:exosortase